jgi:hypothetical protein
LSGGELVELPTALPRGGRGADGLDELDVYLHPVAGQLLLVALPALAVGLYFCEAGSRFISRRLRIRHTPEREIVTSW